MSQGKYSPTLTRAMLNARDENTFRFNAMKQIAPDYDRATMAYDEKIHLGNYDEDGFDSYGYSAWNEDGTYAGIGNGIDRAGYTEMDYLRMSNEDFNAGCY